MKKSRKEFINKAHENACDAWKTKIEEEFPKLFKKEEKANGWYKDTTIDKWCMFFENGIMKYGVSTLGRWSEDLNIPYTLMDNDYKATDKEVGDALIKKAKKKGFEIGIKTEYGAINNNYKHEFRPKTNVFYFGNIEVFNNGKWATIIKEPIVKDVLEVGKWYRNNRGGLFNYNGIKDSSDYPCGYGVGPYGDWFKSNLNGWGGTYTLATDKEVEQALIKEAKNRYSNGVTIKSDQNGKTYKYNNIVEYWTGSDNDLLMRCNDSMNAQYIFYKGKWAKIVETITKEQAEKELGRVITD
jgi:hypothetical protein